MTGTIGPIMKFHPRKNASMDSCRRRFIVRIADSSAFRALSLYLPFNLLKTIKADIQVTIVSRQSRSRLIITRNAMSRIFSITTSLKHLDSRLTSHRTEEFCLWPVHVRFTRSTHTNPRTPPRRLSRRPMVAPQNEDRPFLPLNRT